MVLIVVHSWDSTGRKLSYQLVEDWATRDATRKVPHYYKLTFDCSRERQPIRRTKLSRLGFNLYLWYLLKVKRVKDLKVTLI